MSDHDPAIKQKEKQTNKIHLIYNLMVETQMPSYKLVVFPKIAVNMLVIICVTLFISIDYMRKKSVP